MGMILLTPCSSNLRSMKSDKLVAGHRVQLDPFALKPADIVGFLDQEIDFVIGGAVAS